MFVVFGVENCSNSVICFVFVLFGVGNCSNSVICFVFLLNFVAVLTVWYVLFSY